MFANLEIFQVSWNITLRNARSLSLSFSLERGMAYELRVQYFKENKTKTAVTYT